MILKKGPTIVKKNGMYICFSEHCHGNMCNLNVIVLLEFISKDLYLLFAILLSSKLQNSIFYQSMRPKSGLKFPRPLNKYFMDIFVGTLFVLDFGIFWGYVTKKEYIYILGFKYNI